MAAKRFTVELERVGKTGTMFRVPFDLKEAFGQARPPVRVTIRGYDRTTPGVYGGVGHIVVNRSVKAATGVDAGERVEVAMKLDSKPRRVAVPRTCRGVRRGMRRRARPSSTVLHTQARVHGVDRGGEASGDARPPCGRHRRACSSGRAARLMPKLRGALAAAVTPLTEGGTALDEDAFAPYADFLVAGGLDGILALGTTGEGLLFAPEERRRVVELYVAASAGRLLVAAHCGAQTTRDTVALAEHAAAAGADAVAVIGPPYFQLDERALLEHFAAAAAACAPLPFYVYEFERASGYAVPLPVLFELRERAPNLAGLKVSDAPFDRFKPYLIEGLDVFVGPEVLISDGIGAGAVGAVSASPRRSPSRSPRRCAIRARPPRSSSASCGRRSSSSRVMRR